MQSQAGTGKLKCAFTGATGSLLSKNQAGTRNPGAGRGQPHGHHDRPGQQHALRAESPPRATGNEEDTRRAL